MKPAPTCPGCQHQAAAHDRAGCCITACQCQKAYLPPRQRQPIHEESEIGRIFREAQKGSLAWGGIRRGLNRRAIRKHEPEPPRTKLVSSEPLFCPGCTTPLQARLTYGKLSHVDAKGDLHFPETCLRWLRIRGPQEFP